MLVRGVLQCSKASRVELRPETQVLVPGIKVSRQHTAADCRPMHACRPITCDSSQLMCGLSDHTHIHTLLTHPVYWSQASDAVS